MLKRLREDQKQSRKDAAREKTIEALTRRDLLTTLVGEIEGLSKKKTIDDGHIKELIGKFVKNNLDTQMKATNVDQLKLLQLEQSILEGYLPQKLSDGKLYEIIVDMVTSLEESNKSPNIGPRIGPIMGLLKANYSGQYDGRVAKEMIEKVLRA